MIQKFQSSIALINVTNNTIQQFSDVCKIFESHFRPTVYGFPSPRETCQKSAIHDIGNQHFQHFCLVADKNGNFGNIGKTLDLNKKQIKMDIK